MVIIVVIDGNSGFSVDDHDTSIYQLSMLNVCI